MRRSSQNRDATPARSSVGGRSGLPAPGYRGPALDGEPATHLLGRDHHGGGVCVAGSAPRAAGSVYFPSDMCAWFARRGGGSGWRGTRSARSPRGFPVPPEALLVLALLGVTGGLSASSSKRPEGDGRVVILLSVDTLTPEALVAPTVEHPALSRLAAASLRFTDALSTASWTLPAHASLMTGLYPDRHRATDPRKAISADLPRLAGLLRAAGYRTVAFTDGVYLEPLFGFAEGFDVYDAVRAPDATSGVPDLPRRGLPNPVHGETLFDRAAAYLEGRTDDAPLFLFLHTYSVHDYMLLRPWVQAALP